MPEENIFADVIKEETPVDSLNDSGEQTPPESQPDTKPEAEKKEEVKEVPFHKHPRWIHNQKELKEARDRISQLEESMKEAYHSNKDDEVSVPDWWIKLYGNDERSIEGFKVFAQASQIDKETIKKEILEDMRKEAENESQIEREIAEGIRRQLDEIKEEGVKFEENELMKFILDYTDEFGDALPKLPEGGYDFRKIINLKNRISPAPQDNTSDEKKKIADVTIRHNKVTSKDTIPVFDPRMRGDWKERGF